MDALAREVSVPRRPDRDSERGTDGWTYNERWAIGLVELCLRTRNGKIFGTGLNRWLRRKCRLSTKRASEIICHVLTESGYYEALSARAAQRYPELTRQR